MMSIKRLAAAALATMLLAGTATAGTILVDFETTPGADGKLGTADDLPMSNDWMQAIGNDLSSAGITFTQGTLFTGSFFDGNPNNHFLSSTSPIGSFSVPVYGISIESYSLWNATLYAYDSHGNVLASDHLVNSTGDWLRQTLSLTSTQAIAGFAVLPDQNGQILNLDNMRLITGPSPVPEPSSLAMMAGGLSLLAWRRRAARK